MGNVLVTTVEPGSGPDADSGHAPQDQLKRVLLDGLLNLDGDLAPLPTQFGVLRAAREDEGCDVGARDLDSLPA